MEFDIPSKFPLRIWLLRTRSTWGKFERGAILNELDYLLVECTCPARMIVNDKLLQERNASLYLPGSSIARQAQKLLTESTAAQPRIRSLQTT